MASTRAVEVLQPYQAMLSRSVADVAADMEAFSALLLRWNRTHNIVSRETLAAELWQRHVRDSLRALPLIRTEDHLLADVGSGGGFPALPLAIALKGSGRRHLLIESNARKASFLRAVVRELELEAAVDTSRAEVRDSRETADVVTARAVARLVALFPLVQPLFGSDTRGVFHKGREYDEELQEAAQRWRFDEIVHVDNGGDGVLIEVSNLEARF
jgi:16S rRNA (guanine527-N7)-methyltransferase